MVLSELVAFWVILAALSFGEVKRVALASRLLPPKYECFPFFICFTSAQDRSTDPIPSLLDMLWQSTKPRTLV